MQSDIQSTTLPTSQWFRRNLKWIGILAFLFLAGLVLWRSGVNFSFLAGGWLDKDEKQALEMVKLFHERMNAGHFDEIYDDAYPAFQQAESRQEWLRHMKETREQYGLYRARRSQTLEVIMGPPLQVRVTYEATFEHGDARETFSFARDGDKLQLLEYGTWGDHPGFLVGVISVLHQ